MGAIVKGIASAAPAVIGSVIMGKSASSGAAQGGMSTHDFVEQMQTSQMTDQFQQQTQAQIDQRKKILEGQS